jgi:hypothetical protein
MYSKTINIELEKKDDIVSWENLTDAHVGHVDFDRDLFIKRVNAILDEPLRFTSFGGDQWDMILPKGDPRYETESVAINTMTEQIDDFDNLIQDLLIEQVRFKKSYGCEKIWGLLWGNHEWNSRIIDEKFMKSYCRKRNMTFLGARCMLRVNIKHNGKTLMKKDILYAHGAGGSKSTLKPLNDMAVNVEADIFMMGHLHQQAGYKQLTQYYNTQKQSWDTKRILKVNGGCFTETLTLGKDSWLEHKKNEIVASEPGTVTISFDAYKGKISFHM